MCFACVPACAGYPRYGHPRDNCTYRIGAGGQRICKVTAKNTHICNVREHVHVFSQNHSDLLDAGIRVRACPCARVRGPKSVCAWMWVFEREALPG